MLCPYCKRQTPLYKKTCVNCGKELPRDIGDALFSDEALASIESSIEQATTTKTYAVGETIAGRYVVKGLIGRGNFVTVYRCQDEQTRKTVALKTIYERLLPDERSKQRFFASVEKARQLDQRDISRLLEYGEDNGLVYVISEYLIGQTLATLLRLLRDKKKAPDHEQVQGVLLQLCDALAAAHQHVVHFNLRPQNVFMLKNGIRIADFGIAGGLLFGMSKSDQSLIDGAEYRAPEVIAQSSAAGPTADIYSVGALGCSMLTGAAPGPELGDAAMLAGQFPEALGWVIKACMAQSPASRYGSAGALREALQQAFLGTYLEPAGEAAATVGRESEIDVFAAEPEQTAARPAAEEPMGAIEVSDLLPEAPAATAADLPGTGLESPEEIEIRPLEPRPVIGDDVIQEVFGRAVSETPLPESREPEEEMLLGESRGQRFGRSSEPPADEQFVRIEPESPTTEAEPDAVSKFLSGFEEARRPTPPERPVVPPYERPTVEPEMPRFEPPPPPRPEPRIERPTPAPRPQVFRPKQPGKRSWLPLVIVAAVVIAGIALGLGIYREEISALFSGSEQVVELTPLPTPEPSVEPTPLVRTPTTPRATPEPLETPPADRELQSLLTRADSDFRRGQFRPAANSYRRALQLDPNNSVARERLANMERTLIGQGDSAFSQERWDRAVDRYTEALAINPNSTAARDKRDQARARQIAAAVTPTPAVTPAIAAATPAPTPARTPGNMVDLDAVGATPTPRTVDLDAVPVTPLPRATPVATPKPTPHPTPAPAGAGGLTREQINSTVSQYIGRVKVCYREGLKTNPDLAGMIWVQFNVGADGTVLSAVITQSTLGDAQVEACVLRRVQRMQFPAPAGGSATVNYKFTFQE